MKYKNIVLSLCCITAGLLARLAYEVAFNLQLTEPYIALLFAGTSLMCLLVSFTGLLFIVENIFIINHS